MAEVPSNFSAWTKAPALLYRQRAHGRGRQPKVPRLKVKNNPPAQVRQIALHSPLFRREDWQTYHVKDTHKGPMVWRAKRLYVWLKDEAGLPTRAHHLLVAFNALEPEHLKYFISNAPELTSIQTLLLVALSRWKVERMFEDGKGELGMDHFEVRRFGSIQRHLILSCVSYLFLAEFHEAHRGEKSGPDLVPSAYGDELVSADLEPGGPVLAGVRRIDQPTADYHARTQPAGAPQPPQANSASTARNPTISREISHVSMEAFVALSY